MVDEWVQATDAIAEGTFDSVNPSVVDEEEVFLLLHWMKELSFAMDIMVLEVGRNNKLPKASGEQKVDLANPC